MPEKRNFLPGDGDGIANGEDARVEHADDVSGVGLVDDFPLLRPSAAAAGTGAFSCRPGHGNTSLSRSNLPEQMRMKASRSRWALFMLAWILNTKAEKSGLERRRSTPQSAVPGQGRGRQAQEFLQERLDAEVRQRGAEEHRGSACRPGPRPWSNSRPAPTAARRPRSAASCRASPMSVVRPAGRLSSISSLSARFLPETPEKNSS